MPVKLRKAIVVALIGVGCGTVAPLPVSAHLGLEFSNPAEGATLDTAPPSATLTFSAPVDLDTASASLRHLGGVDVPLTEVTRRDVPTEVLVRRTATDRTVMFDLPPLGPGTYAIDWEVNEAGGHRNKSMILFRVADPARTFRPAWGAVAAVAVVLVVLALRRRSRP